MPTPLHVYVRETELTTSPAILLVMADPGVAPKILPEEAESRAVGPDKVKVFRGGLEPTCAAREEAGTM